jgi:hypothetical protein
LPGGIAGGVNERPVLPPQHGAQRGGELRHFAVGIVLKLVGIADSHGRYTTQHRHAAERRTEKGILLADPYRFQFPTIFEPPA